MIITGYDFESSLVTYQIVYNNANGDQVGGFILDAPVASSWPFTDWDLVAYLDVLYQELADRLMADFYPAGTVNLLSRAFTPAIARTAYEPV